MLSIIFSMLGIILSMLFVGNIFSSSKKVGNIYELILTFLKTQSGMIEPKVVARKVLSIPTTERVVLYHRKQLRESVRNFYEMQAKSCSLKDSDNFVFWQKRQGYELTTLPSLRKKFPSLGKMSNEDIFAELLQDDSNE